MFKQQLTRWQGLCYIVTKMKTKYESKPGTIGRSIEKLVNKTKTNPMMFYILAEALAQACHEQHALVSVNGKLYSQTEGYKKAQSDYDALMAEITKTLNKERSRVTPC